MRESKAEKKGRQDTRPGRLGEEDGEGPRMHAALWHAGTAEPPVACQVYP